MQSRSPQPQTSARPRSRRARRVFALFGSSVLLAMVLGFVSVPAHRAGSAAASTRRAIPANAGLTVASAAGVRTVPSSFFGLSTEYWTLPIYERHLRSFERVLSLLHVPGDGPMVLRIGGDSADHTLWSPGARATPPWVFPVRNSWLSGTARLIQQMRLHVLLDMNLVTGSAVRAARWAKAAEARLPHGSIIGFEVGNEPDIYSRSIWISALAQAQRGGGILPTAITAAGYRRDFSAYARLLSRVAPGVPVIGPVVANPAFDVGWISKLLAVPPPALRVISAHRYPFSACSRPGARNYPTISRILSERATAGTARAVAPAVALAHAAGLQFRLSELNSVTCGGLAGVSNTFATALWAPDALFELVHAGVDAVNLHVREYAINAPFTVGAAGLQARPLLYGMILFTRTLGPHARLLDARLSASPSLHLKAWAVALRGRQLHVLLIDKGARAARVKLRLPASGAATVQRLLAPSVRSTAGVTLAGQQLGLDGRWHGARRVERLVQGPGHVYTLTVPARSAALLSVRGAGR